MNFRLIAEEKPHHSVSRLARVLGVSRAGYYAWQKRPPSERARADAELTKRIKTIHSETDGIYGAPRICEERADEHDVHLGRTYVPTWQGSTWRRWSTPAAATASAGRCATT